LQLLKNFASASWFEWERLDQRITDGAVKEWRKQLRAWAAAEGGQFEHEL